MKIVIAVPAYNEGKIIEANILKLAEFAGQKIKDEWVVVVADNASLDNTAEIVKRMALKFLPIKYLFVPEKGKGHAIKAAWESELADIYIFMDADLSTDISALPELIEKIKAGNDLAVGSRYLADSKVTRSIWRIIFSRFYFFILKMLIGLKSSDAPCGFKAINSKTKDIILPQVENLEWFFDSELLILSEKNNFLISEVPVVWRDIRESNDKSRVNPFVVGWDYLKEVIRLKKSIKSKIN